MEEALQLLMDHAKGVWGEYQDEGTFSSLNEYVQIMNAIGILLSLTTGIVMIEMPESNKEQKQDDIEL